MFKKLLSLGIVLGFAFSILLPNSFVNAETEDEDAATEEEANVEESEEATEETDAEENADEKANEDEEEVADEGEKTEQSESTVAASDGPVDFSIYFYVIGFVVVLILGMYAFTEGVRKK